MGTKISELTAGTAAITDQIPVNQSGTTKRLTAVDVALLSHTTANSATASTSLIAFASGNITGNVAAVSGAITVNTGNCSSTDGESGTGAINIKTGNKTANSSGNPGEGQISGAIVIASGTAKNQFSGNVTIETGGTEYQSGDLFINTGAGLIANDAYSGFIYIHTGACTGTAECGDIHLQPGTNANTPAVNGRVIVESLMRLHVAASDPLGPVQGDIYYNSTANKIKLYNGTAWVTVTSS